MRFVLGHALFVPLIASAGAIGCNSSPSATSLGTTDAASDTGGADSMPTSGDGAAAEGATTDASISRTSPDAALADANAFDAAHAGQWKIMPFGDSITGATCYPQLLSQELIAKDHTNFTFIGTNPNSLSCNSAPNVQTEGHAGFLVSCFDPHEHGRHLQRPDARDIHATRRVGHGEARRRTVRDGH